MTNFTRREFIQASATAYLLQSAGLNSATSVKVTIGEAGDSIQVKGCEYTWEWSQAKDHFRLLDQWGLDGRKGAGGCRDVVSKMKKEKVKRSMNIYE